MSDLERVPRPVATGTAAVAVSAVRTALRSTDARRAVHEVLTTTERSAFAGTPESLALVWAAKEATFSAFGLGLRDASLLDVQVVEVAGGHRLVLHGAVEARALDAEITHLTLSLRLVDGLAVAVVVGKRS